MKKMKQGKAGGPSGVIVNQIEYEEKIPEGWKDSFIQECG